MLKLTKLIFTMLLVISLTQQASILAAELEVELSSAESEFVDLVVKADAKLDLNDSAAAEQDLLQANQILVQNPEINVFFKGHFNKVYGKLYMKYNATVALQYFNTSISQFSENILEQAEVKLFIGITYYHAGNYALAKNYFETAKAIFDSQGDMQKSAQALNNIGVIHFLLGNSQIAVSFCERSYSINTEIGNRVNAERNRQNLEFFTGGDGVVEFGNLPGENLLNVLGGSGTGGSTITTSGGGTVVVPPVGG